MCLYVMIIQLLQGIKR